MSKGERTGWRSKQHNGMPPFLYSKHSDLENEKDITAENNKWFQTYFMSLKGKPVMFFKISYGKLQTYTKIDKINGISSFNSYQHTANFMPFVLSSTFSCSWITLKLNLDINSLLL